MITSLFNLIFKIIGFLANIILTPLFSLISTFIPQFDNLLGNIDYFFDYGCQHISFVCHYLMIPSALFKTFFSFFGSLLLGFVAVGVIRLSMKIYETFKP